MTQVKLAKLVGASRETISQIENGNQKPTLPLFRRIAYVLKADVYMLLEIPNPVQQMVMQKLSTGAEAFLSEEGMQYMTCERCRSKEQIMAEKEKMLGEKDRMIMQLEERIKEQADTIAGYKKRENEFEERASIWKDFVKKWMKE